MEESFDRRRLARAGMDLKEHAPARRPPQRIPDSTFDPSSQGVGGARSDNWETMMSSDPTIDATNDPPTRPTTTKTRTRKVLAGLETSATDARRAGPPTGGRS